MTLSGHWCDVPKQHTQGVIAKIHGFLIPHRYISGRIGSCVDDTAGSMGRRVPQLPAASTVKGVIGEALDGHKRELIPTTVEKQEEPEGRLEDSSTPKEDGRVLRDEAKEMGAPVASSTGGIPAAARTVTAVGGGGAEQEGYANREQARPRARGETGAGLRGARGRWGKRSKEEVRDDTQTVHLARCRRQVHPCHT